MIRVNLALKRFFDILFSLFGLMVSSMLWIIISMAIYIEDGGPVLFADMRVGKDRRLYRHFKFRTMKKEAERTTGPIWSTKEDRRIIKVGRFLRATAIDELPQLINILKGDMSFVGPRPEREHFVNKFTKEIPGYQRRFCIRPGLTGMAQVYGKHDSLPEKKLKYDLEYIDRQSVPLDLKLIFLSFLITSKAGWEKFEKT